MPDRLYRGLLAAEQVRFAVADTTDLCGQAVLAHHCDPLSAHVLARALGAGVLLSPLLNEDERYTLRWHYPGALQSVVLDVGADATVRGFVSPPNLHDFVNCEDEIYGDAGRVAVTKSVAGRTLNAGTAAAPLLDVVADLAHFFAVSDQLETALLVLIAFNADPAHPVRQCQGMMLQAMPGCDLPSFDRLRSRLASTAQRDLVAGPLADAEVAADWLAALLDRPGPRPEVTTGPAPRFYCGCSRERVLAALRTLSAESRAAVRQTGETIAVTCQFCGRRYTFAAAEVPVT